MLTEPGGGAEQNAKDFSHLTIIYKLATDISTEFSCEEIIAKKLSPKRILLKSSALPVTD